MACDDSNPDPACVCLQNRNRFSTIAHVSSFTGSQAGALICHGLTPPPHRCVLSMRLHTGNSCLLLMVHFFPLGCRVFTGVHLFHLIIKTYKTSDMLELCWQFQERSNKRHAWKTHPDAAPSSSHSICPDK